MAQAASGMADTAEVARLAESIVEGQKSEMRLMADMLAELGAPM